MIEVKTKPDPDRIFYESTSLTRWNMCQKFAKSLYRSGVPTEEIEQMFTSFNEVHGDFSK